MLCVRNMQYNVGSRLGISMKMRMTVCMIFALAITHQASACESTINAGVGIWNSALEGFPSLSLSNTVPQIAVAAAILGSSFYRATEAAKKRQEACTGACLGGVVSLCSLVAGAMVSQEILGHVPDSSLPSSLGVPVLGGIIVGSVFGLCSSKKGKKMEDTLFFAKFFGRLILRAAVFCKIVSVGYAALPM